MDDLRDKYLKAIAAATDEAALEELRIQAVGKKGEVSLQMRELGKMTPEERQVAGPRLNALKDEINSALAAKKQALGDAALDERLQTEWLDVTLPGRPRRTGTIHPISQVTEEVTAIFADLGFSVAEGPQVESDWYNFDALNIPGHHPARAEMDTFYMHRAAGDERPPHVLRTHTSPVQIRSMQAQTSSPFSSSDAVSSISISPTHGWNSSIYSSSSSAFSLFPRLRCVPNSPSLRDIADTNPTASSRISRDLPQP